MADEEDFREFVVAHRHALLRYATLVVGDRGLAEDVVQSVLERCHRQWDRIGRADIPEAYVRKAITNEAISRSRRRHVREVSLTAAADVPSTDAHGKAELRHDLWLALGGLPPRMRAVLVLRYFEDLPEAEVAAVLGCSVGSVKSQASRGLTRLSTVVAPMAVSGRNEGGVR